MNKKLIIALYILGILYPQNNKKSIHQNESISFKKNINFLKTKKVNVQTGLDILLDRKNYFIDSKNIALVTNQTGVDKKGVPNYRRFLNLDNVHLKVIFTPEHGLFGEAENGEKIEYKEGVNSNELPKIISLYGAIRKPSDEMLSNIDLIIYDIQDIGSRFYTYISTLGLIMEAAAKLEIPLLVLDRPNPIRNDILEGPILDLKYKSFVGYYPIPIRYGKTIGGLTRAIIKNKWISPLPKIDIIDTEGWTEDLWFDETDLNWINPSPNIQGLEAAILYPGMCLLEGSNISEGRGTSDPFKWFGAPWVDGLKISEALTKYDLPGVKFVPRRKTPISIPGKALTPKFMNEKCHGVEVWITNRNKYRSIETGLLILFTINTMYPNKIKLNQKFINMLWGSEHLYNELKNNSTGTYFINNYVR